MSDYLTEHGKRRKLTTAEQGALDTKRGGLALQSRRDGKRDIERNRDRDMSGPVTVEFGALLYGFREIDQIRFDQKINRNRPFGWKTVAILDEEGAIVTPAEWVTLPIPDAQEIALLIDDARTKIFIDADTAKAAL